MKYQKLILDFFAAKEAIKKTVINIPIDAIDSKYSPDNCYFVTLIECVDRHTQPEYIDIADLINDFDTLKEVQNVLINGTDVEKNELHYLLNKIIFDAERNILRDQLDVTIQTAIIEQLSLIK